MKLSTKYILSAFTAFTLAQAVPAFADIKMGVAAEPMHHSPRRMLLANGLAGKLIL